jgi:hypothetical protein
MWITSQKAGGRIDDAEGIIGEAKKEMCYIISLYIVGSTLCVVIKLVCVIIPIYFMYYIFFKFTIHDEFWNSLV